MIRRGLLAAAVAGAAWLSLPSAALATTQSAQMGTVKATFSFTKTSAYRYKKLRLKITDAGKVLYDQPVRQPLCSPYCQPGDARPHHSSVEVVELEPGSSPNVVLNLFSAGAHCCFFTQVFSLDPGTMTYSKEWHDFGNPGAELEQEPGLAGEPAQRVFITNDNNFYYTFTDYADSGAPIQIYRFFHGKFADVTRNYPSLIEKQAAQLWSAFTHDHRNGNGFIAAWAADEDLLGNFELAQSRLKQQLKAHHLHSPGYPWPGGEKFIDALNKFLVRLKYQAGPNG
jgi:hypothetical protein